MQIRIPSKILHIYKSKLKVYTKKRKCYITCYVTKLTSAIGSCYAHKLILQRRCPDNWELRAQATFVVPLANAEPFFTWENVCAPLCPVRHEIFARK